MRKYLLLAVLLTCCLTGCARLLGTWDAEFRSADRLVAEKQYNKAIETYDRIAKESPGSERGAGALFAAAFTGAFYDNPHKDYSLALEKFDDFLRQYPDNKRATDAQNWRQLLKVVVELKKENEHLTTSIEQLKKIDIRHEERRKGK